MSASDFPYDDLALDQCHQDLVDLARLLGVNPDAPDVVVQFAAALVLAIPSLLSWVQTQSPTKSGRKRTWQAGLYDELYRDVNKTMADLNCSSIDAIKHLREDRNGRWWRHSQPSLETRYREARAHVRETTRDRITRLLVQQGTPLHA
jgi:hypothetical protein